MSGTVRLGPNHPDYGKVLPMGEAPKPPKGKRTGRPPRPLPADLVRRLVRNGGPR